MIDDEVVFVIGAGASWHFGMPTGSDLIELVAETGIEFARYCMEAKQVLPMPLPKIVAAQNGNGDSEKWQTCLDRFNQFSVNLLLLKHPDDLLFREPF